MRRVVVLRTVIGRRPER